MVWCGFVFALWVCKRVGGGDANLGATIEGDEAAVAPEGAVVGKADGDAVHAEGRPAQGVSLAGGAIDPDFPPGVFVEKVFPSVVLVRPATPCAKRTISSAVE